MSHEELLKRITVDPNMMVGQPCIRGMRITVQHILETLGMGATQEELLEDLPVLEPEDIRAALMYGAAAAAQARDCGGLVHGVTCERGVMTGKPVLRGTRITVEQILHDMALGASVDEFLEDFPYLKPQDIMASVVFAGRLLAGTRVQPAL